MRPPFGVVVAVLAAVCSQPLLTAATAAATILYFAPGPMAQPLDTVGFPVTVQTVHFLDARGTDVTGTLYLPRSWGRHASVVLVHGWTDLADQAPAAVRFGQAMARTGHAVLVPRLTRLAAGYVDDSAIDGLVGAVRYLGSRTDVDPERIALFGVCLGAAVAITSASDPRMPRLRMVAGVNAYYDVVDLIQAVTTGTVSGGDRMISWSPYPPVAYLVRLNVSSLTHGHPDLTAAVNRILENRDASRVRMLVDALPASARHELGLASPAASIARLQTRLVLLQAAADPVVPPGSLEQFERALGPGGVISLGSTNALLQHNDLRPPPLDWQSFEQVYLPGGTQLMLWANAVLSTLDG
jgi:dienelactone hydrolase